MKSQELNKEDMLKSLKKIVKGIQNDEITDLVILGYGNRKVQGGVFADPIVGYGLIKRLESEIPPLYKKADVNSGLDNLIKYLSGDEH